jgi:hypothetical protein
MARVEGDGLKDKALGKGGGPKNAVGHAGRRSSSRKETGAAIQAAEK